MKYRIVNNNNESNNSQLSCQTSIIICTFMLKGHRFDNCTMNFHYKDCYQRHKVVIPILQSRLKALLRLHLEIQDWNKRCHWNISFYRQPSCLQWCKRLYSSCQNLPLIPQPPPGLSLELYPTYQKAPVDSPTKGPGSLEAHPLTHSKLTPWTEPWCGGSGG